MGELQGLLGEESYDVAQPYQDFTRRAASMGLCHGLYSHERGGFRLRGTGKMEIEDMTGLVATVMFWLVLAAIVILPVYLRYRDRGRLHETLRIAFEKGQPVPAELIAVLQNQVPANRPSTPERDLRNAVVLIAVGLGLVGLGYGMWYGLMSVSQEAAYITGGAIAGAGAIPGLIGVAYGVLWATRRNKTQA
jgi:hypothetical protein